MKDLKLWKEKKMISDQKDSNKYWLSFEIKISHISAMLNLIRTVGMGSSLALSSAIVSSTMIANGVEPDFSREMFSLERQ